MEEWRQLQEPKLENDVYSKKTHKYGYCDALYANIISNFSSVTNAINKNRLNWSLYRLAIQVSNHLPSFNKCGKSKTAFKYC